MFRRSSAVTHLITTRALLGSALVALAVLTACDATAPAVPILLTATGAPLTGVVGAPLDNDARIEFRDATGRAIGGVPFTVHVASGNGSLVQMFRQTLPGPTPVGSWTLGTAAGAQSLVVESPGFNSITLSATARAGPPATAETDATTLVASVRINAAYIVRPTILVRDAFGNPAPDVAVSVVLTGGGTVENASPVTSSDGRATVGVWTMAGDTGVETLTMRAGNAPPVVFTANVTEPYNVVVRFVGTPPAEAVQAAFTNAAQRLEQVIVNGVPPVTLTNFNAGFQCQIPQLPILSETVDDLVILAQIIPLDGLGGLLGQAGPCGFRNSGTPLPFIGVMQFDAADVNSMLANGRFGAVVLHEMTHVVGFGTLWPSLGLLSGVNGVDPIFTGASARAEFLAAGGTSGSGVPVEANGGSGTAFSHWRETVFRDELMTGFLTGPFQPYSRTTIASLEGLGYTVSYASADPFAIFAALRVPVAGGDSLVEWERVLMPARSELERILRGRAVGKQAQK